MSKILDFQNKVLKVLSGKLEGFYLAGGTALALAYFKHRESHDLDFFTKEFLRPKVEKIMTDLASVLEVKIALQSQQTQKGRAQMLIYRVPAKEKAFLKIDFVEDVYDLMEPLNDFNGIPVLSIKDIYLRKVFAACGSAQRNDDAGKGFFAGGRQEAKDFFDLYFLSMTFMRLSKFASQYCGPAQRESIVVWHRSYDRLTIKSGLADIITDKSADYQEMDRHFKSQIEQMIRQELL